MGTAKGVRKSYTEWGKVLARLRINASENLTQQARRLGFNAMYLSFIQNGRKKLTPAVYERLLLCYPPLNEHDKETLLRGCLTDEENGRFEKVFGAKAKGVGVRERVYIITGYAEHKSDV